MGSEGSQLGDPDPNPNLEVSIAPDVEVAADQIARILDVLAATHCPGVRIPLIETLQNVSVHGFGPPALIQCLPRIIQVG